MSSSAGSASAQPDNVPKQLPVAEEQAKAGAEQCVTDEAKAKAVAEQIAADEAFAKSLTQSQPSYAEVAKPKPLDPPAQVKMPAPFGINPVQFPALSATIPPASTAKWGMNEMKAPPPKEQDMSPAYGHCSVV